MLQTVSLFGHQMVTAIASRSVVRGNSDENSSLEVNIDVPPLALLQFSRM